MQREPVAVGEVGRDAVDLRGRAGRGRRHLLAQEHPHHHEPAIDDADVSGRGAQDQEAGLRENPEAVRIIREIVAGDARRRWIDAIHLRQRGADVGALVDENVGEVAPLVDGDALDEARALLLHLGQQLGADAQRIIGRARVEAIKLQPVLRVCVEPAPSARVAQHAGDQTRQRVAAAKGRRARRRRGARGRAPMPTANTIAAWPARRSWARAFRSGHRPRLDARGDRGSAAIAASPAAPGAPPARKRPARRAPTRQRLRTAARGSARRCRSAGGGRRRRPR